MLKAQQIYKIYHQAGTPLEVLKGVDFFLSPGELVSLVGPSGAGKSTLLHILGGLDVPSRGKVFIDGEDVHRLDDRRRSLICNAKIGFVFQFYHLLPDFNAMENVMLPAFIQQGMAARTKIEDRARALLSRVGLESRLTHKPKQLSGGEQQRVAIARALINSPKMIFCDEPTGNLDSASGHNIIELLLRINREERQAVVIVTHDPVIAQKAQRCVHIQDGMITNLS